MLSLCVAAIAQTISFNPFELKNDKGGVIATGELGSLKVPENRKKPHGTTVEIAVFRLRTRASKPGVPIVYLAGGPGGSGVETAKGDALALFETLAQQADVILLDQRGTGRSKPSLMCPEKLDLPLDKPETRAAMQAAAQEWSAKCASVLASQNIDVAAYNTVESADDIEDLRRALAVPQLDLLAHSYGTHLALSVLRRHPESIHRAVLAGVEGPDDTLKLPANIQAQLEQIGKLIAADPYWNSRIPDFIGLTRSLLDKLDKEPVSVTATHPRTNEKAAVAFGKLDLQLVLASGIGNRRAIEFYPLTVYQLSRGEYDVFARNTFLFRTAPRRVSAMTFACDCSSGASAERRRLIEEQAPHTLLGDAVDFQIQSACAAWKIPDAGGEFRSPVSSKTPTLFVSGTLDGRTPPSNAAAIARGFSHAQQLVAANATHVDLLAATAITDKIAEFLSGKDIGNVTVEIPPPQFRRANTAP